MIISFSPVVEAVLTMCILQPAKSMSGVMSVKLTLVPFANETQAAREVPAVPTLLISSVDVMTSDL